MKILEVTILTSEDGPDNILLQTDLPNAQYPYNGLNILKFVAAKGTGKDYVFKYFPEIETVVVKSV